MTTDERIKALVEILKIVAWPVVVVWLFWCFRDAVNRAFTRITEIGLTGAKFAPEQQTPSLPTGGVTLTPSDHQSGSPIIGTPVLKSGSGGSGLQQLISNITAFISKDQLDPSLQATRSDLETKIGHDLKDQVEALLYNSASLNVQLAHERNYNVIFGSQLQLLAQANIDFGALPTTAKAIYDTAKSANPEVYRSFTFEQWLGFLQGAGLITTAPNRNYLLTNNGRGFLKYILDRHLSISKPF